MLSGTVHRSVVTTGPLPFDCFEGPRWKSQVVSVRKLHLHQPRALDLGLGRLLPAHPRGPAAVTSVRRATTENGVDRVEAQIIT